MVEVYFDYNSTSPLEDRVRSAIGPWIEDDWGNASAREYRKGWIASEAVGEARDTVAQVIHANSRALIFTSGASEALCAVIRSFVGYSDWEECKIVTWSTEHAAVLRPCEDISKKTNMVLKVLPVDRNGSCNIDDFRSALESKQRCLVAIMAANNEIGTIHPVDEICRLTHLAEGLFMCDLAQAVGKLSVNVIASEFDYAAFSAHKMYGPKGVGALFIREGAPFEPLIPGGQERGLRGGTLNVPGIVGFGEACRIAKEEMADDIPRMERLRNKLEKTLLADLPDIWINGAGAPRLCNTSNIGFRGVDARTMIRDMHDIACSTKSACSSGDPGPSHVLKAIGLTDEEAYSCIRFSLGKFTTEAEIDYAIEKIVTSVRKLRRNSSYGSYP